MKVGIYVQCETCGHQKKPRGRSAPMQMFMCRPDECVGYELEPRVGDLWPRETEEEFGYPISADGTREDNL